MIYSLEQFMRLVKQHVRTSRWLNGTYLVRNSSGRLIEVGIKLYHLYLQKFILQEVPDTTRPIARLDHATPVVNKTELYNYIRHTIEAEGETVRSVEDQMQVGDDGSEVPKSSG